MSSESSPAPKRPVIRSVVHFKSTYQMLASMTDSFQAYDEWHKKTGMIHGDISPNTILIATKDGVEKGVLADWDPPLDMAHTLRTSGVKGKSNKALFMYYMSLDQAPLSPSLHNMMQKIRHAPPGDDPILHYAQRMRD